MKIKTMKVIDLLDINNKPKNFKYKKYIWKQQNNMNIYVNEYNIEFETYLASVQICDLGRLFSEVLNDEVEILEDKPKNIDEIDIIDNFTGLFGNTPMTEQLELNFQQVNGKFNELTKAVNYLLEKSEDNDS